MCLQSTPTQVDPDVDVKVWSRPQTFHYISHVAREALIWASLYLCPTNHQLLSMPLFANSSVAVKTPSQPLTLFSACSWCRLGALADRGSILGSNGGNPWGFTLQGGVDFRSPLRVGRVSFLYTLVFDTKLNRQNVGETTISYIACYLGNTSRKEIFFLYENFALYFKSWMQGQHK